MRNIYFSPHLDDAIYSCGGLIADQVRSGQPVDIWTVCAGDPPDGPLSPFAEVLHASWGFGRDAPTMRRAEDIAACKIVGAAHRHFSFMDAIYRSGPDGEWLYNPETLMDEIHPADAPQVETLRLLLKALLRPDDVLFCPLTVGGHTDHRLTRRAVDQLGRSLTYFADFPYVQNQVPEPLTGGMHLEIRPISAEGLHRWQDGVAAYASQLATFWPSLDAMREVISTYGENGIRLWKPG